MDRDLEALLLEYHYRCVMRKCLQVFYITELREKILEHLPLEALYRAKLVSKTWRQTIEQSQRLQRLMFNKAEREEQQANAYHYKSDNQSIRLNATVITINPIVSRTIIIPRAGDIGMYAMLESQGRSLPTVPDLVVNGLTRSNLTENVLKCRPANLVERCPPQELVDNVARPFRFYKQGSLPENSIPVPNHKKLRGKKTLQQEWKSMFFCQPPVEELALVHRRGRTAWIVQQYNGIKMESILSSLQGVFREDDFPLELKYPYARQEIDIMLPMLSGNGEQVVDERGMKMFRALNTKLRCRFEALYGECGIKTIFARGPELQAEIVHIPKTQSHSCG